MSAFIRFLTTELYICTITLDSQNKSNSFARLSNKSYLNLYTKIHAKIRVGCPIALHVFDLSMHICKLIQTVITFANKTNPTHKLLLLTTTKQYLDKIDHKHNTHFPWGTITKLSNKILYETNKNLFFQTKTVTTDKIKAKALD